LQGDTIVVGAARADLAGNVDQGAVYSFTRSSESGGDAWSEGQKLVAEDGVAESLFGRSVALGLNMLLAGAPGSEIGASLEQGAVYVFARDGNVGPWNEQQKLLAEDGAAGDTFGEAVAVAGNWAGVGAYLADIGDTADQGAGYIFARAGGVWGERQKLVAGDGTTGDYFGFSVALDGNRAVIGAVLADIGGRIDRGAAYVYAVDGASWWWEQKLPAGESVADNSSSSGAYDYFGFSSALDGDTALVGAIWAGVAGDEGAGQAHFFSREQGYFGLYLPMGWNQ
jgi:hypothetical protein